MTSTSLCAVCSQLFMNEENIRLFTGDEGLFVKWEYEALVASAKAGCCLCSSIINNDNGECPFIVEDGVPDSVHFWAFTKEPHGRPLDMERMYIEYWFEDFDVRGNMELAVSAASDDPAAETISSRPVIWKVNSDGGHSMNSERVYSLINAKIHECLSQHSSCPIPMLHSMPKRVIDVGNGHEAPHLMETNGIEGYYTALTYCWGMEKQPVMTVEDNVEPFTTTLPMPELPQTVQDAIEITRHLGIRYIWIDSLCIVQDSPSDKAEEIGKMQHIFSHAYLTISAASAKNCTDGIYQAQPDQDYHSDILPFRELKDFEIPFRCEQGLTGHLVVQSYIPANPPSLPINKRAWTLQERVLSSRVLLYANRSLVWQCPHESMEFERRESPELASQYKVSGSILLNLLKYEDSPSFEALDILYGRWTNLVMDYSRRKLGDRNDRLSAVSGIAARFAVALPGHHYSAGLWQILGIHDNEYLLPQLLWIVVPPRDSHGEYLHYLPGYDGSDIRGDGKAPSWSWASVSWPVSYTVYFTLEARASPSEPCAEVFSCITTPLHGSNPFGRVCGGLLTIRGLCQVLLITIGRCTADTGSVARVRLPDRKLAWVIQIDLSSIPGGFDGQPQTVTLLHLLRNKGLVLVASSGGFFKRVGVFQVLGGKVGDSTSDKANEAKRTTPRFFKDCDRRTLVIE